MSYKKATLGIVLATGICIAQPVAAQSWQFQCAPSGTVVERSNGTRIVFRGQDPQNRLVCLDEQGQRRFLGYWPVQENFFRAGSAQLARMTAAAHAGVPAEETVRYFGTDRYGLSNTIVETWRIGTVQPVRVPAGEFQAMQVERDFQVVGSTYRYGQTVWFDSRTGVPIKARVEHLNPIMAPTLQNWEATSVHNNYAGLAR